MPNWPTVLASFFHSQFFVTPEYPTQSCVGKTVCVTGANVGLGKEAARHFVRLGAERVILACRSTEKGEAAKNEIESSEKSSGVVEVWQLDLSSYESVQQFAKKIDGLKRLDIMLENAGINTTKFKLFEDNESTITTNVVSTFLLALNVLPALRRTAQTHNTLPVLTIVSSEVHFFTSFPERQSPSIFATLNDPDAARMSDRYNVSKMLEVLFCRELAAKCHPDYPVVIDFVNPGLCHSELAREIMNPVFAVLMKIIARTTEVGSRTLVHAAMSGREAHGRYMSNCSVTPPAPLVTSAEGEKAQKRVWEELSARLEQIQPGVMGNL